jgi:hypothetical protein
MGVSKRRHLDKPMLAAINEIEALILKSYPETAFLLDLETDSQAVYVIATVNVDDPEEIIDCYIDRILELQIEDGLPLHFVPIRTPERRDRMWAEQQHARPSTLLPSSASR